MTEVLSRSGLLTQDAREKRFPEDQFYSVVIGEPRVTVVNGYLHRRCIYVLYAEKSAISLENWQKAIIKEEESNNQTGPLGV